MTFDELWERVPGLPYTAKKHVPESLSQDTKKKLEQYTPFQIGAMVRFAINEIEHGSIETIDNIVRKQVFKNPTDAN